MKSEARILGVDELEKTLKALHGALPDRVIQYGLRAAAKEAQRAAKQADFAFTDITGRVRKSIKASPSKKKRHAGTERYAKLTIGGAGAKQGPLLELGTESMKKRAPLRRAVHDTLAKALVVARQAMSKRLVKLGRDARAGRLRGADLNAALNG